MTDIHEGDRVQRVREVVDHDLLPGLRDRYDVKLYAFGADAEPIESLDAVRFERPSTDMARGLNQVASLTRDVPLGGVILITDGQTVDEPAALKAAKLLRQSGVPVYAFPIGTPEEAADVSLASVSGEQIVPFEPRVRLRQAA